MKKIIFLLFFSAAFSQQNNSTLKVAYLMTIANDKGVSDYNSVLYVNNKYSRFDFWLEKNQKDENRLDSENNYTININKLDTLKNSIFLDKINTKTYTVIENNPDISYYEELTPIHWELSNEQKKIDKYLCNKAEAKFRGRNYIAYYTEEIPVSNGPFKFWGLPGLIMEIYDSNNEVYFAVKKITIPYVTDISFPFSVDKIIKHRNNVRKENQDIIQSKNQKLLDAKSRMESKNGRSMEIKINSVNIEYNKGIELD